MFNQTCTRRAAVLAVVLCGMDSGAFSQAPPAPAPPPVPRPQFQIRPPDGAVPQPGQGGKIVFSPGASQGEMTVLSRNFRLKLTLKNGDSSETVEVVTASPSLSFNGSLGKSPSMRITFNGTLRETEAGGLILQYSVGGRVPEIAEAVSSGPGGPGLAVRNIEYTDETSTGALHLKAGTEHTLFKSGPRAYTVTVTPDEEGK